MTDDDPDVRVDAYMASRDAGIDPDDVLSSDPPEAELAAAGVIEMSEETTGVNERRNELLVEVRDLLEEIRDQGAA